MKRQVFVLELDGNGFARKEASVEALNVLLAAGWKPVMATPIGQLSVYGKPTVGTSLVFLEMEPQQ